ncbi:MAG: cell envelope integrity protein TolA, partial [Pseudomonadota bacterium]|nr:cell envelope integrity protein TolA [Pseudomonadota bacterium]
SEEAARADAAATPGNRGDDDGLRARYAAAIQEAILRNWTRPDNVPLGQRCRIVIRQIPGGQVISAEVEPSCPFDDLGRRSVERAVLMAQPLPYAGFESVFSRQLNVNFTAQDR